MSDPAQPSRNDRERMDAICDAFESAWKQGEQPRIEDFLNQWQGEAWRRELLYELIQSEWELSGASGREPDTDVYVERFPDAAQHIRRLAESIAKSPESSETPEAIAHYRLIRPLGAGGMGEVFLAEDSRLGRQVAIKLLPVEWAAHRVRRQRFMTEARAAASINHPNVCTIHEVGETPNGRPYITMEFLEGETLEGRIRRGGVQIPEAIEIGLQVADALDAALTRSVVHRDLKPGNISMDGRGRVKVLDFGLAKRMDDDAVSSPDATTEERTRSGQILGTPNYMSPEQSLGNEVDHRSDLWSLGVVLYELITGHQPFAGKSFTETIQNIGHSHPKPIARFNYDVPQELERIILKLMQKRADDRFQSPAELMVDLRNLRRHLETSQASLALSNPAQALHDQDATFLDAVPEAAKTLVGELIPDGDVLLNYAPVDDQPLYEGRKGWVSQLHRHLAIRVEQLSGETVKIARHPGYTGDSETDTELQRHMTNAKAMVSIVSPPFVKRDGCVQEVREFCDSVQQSEGLWVEDKPRLFKVLKTPVSPWEIPNGLNDVFSKLFAFEFYEKDSQTGRVREYDEGLGETLRQRFHERLYDLAYEICQVLKILNKLKNKVQEPGMADTSDRKVIFLANTTSDLQAEHDRIRRELLERGHVVVPESPLPLASQELEREVQGCLEKCDMAIHLLGSHYGVTPEDSSESIPSIQVRLSAQYIRQRPIKRFLWTPPVEIMDVQQIEFLASVAQDHVFNEGAEMIERDFALLKREVIRQLEPPKPKSTLLPDARPVRGDSKMVYLICDPKDEEILEPLEDHLFEQGFEVALPAFDGAPEDAEALHKENLLACDAVIVFYGSAPRSWVDIKLRELLKVPGMGREHPIERQLVYVAPPFDRRKQRYKSLQADIIRQEGAFQPELLADWIQSLKEGKST